MKVKELIERLNLTGQEAEVRLIDTLEDGSGEYNRKLYLSYDDNGDVLIYTERE